jgi:hypothetical protein
MDTAYDVQPFPKVTLERIDVIIRELQELRQVILVQSQSSSENLTDQLWGILAPESKDDEYDPYLDWERFAL